MAESPSEPSEPDNAPATPDQPGAAPSPPSERFVGRALALSLTFALCVEILFRGLIRCPFAKLFHIPCPACGSVRTLHAVFDDNPPGVWSGNPPALLVIIVTGLLGLRAIYVMYRDGHFRELTKGRFGSALARALYVLAAIEVFLWLARFFGYFGGPLRLI